MSFRSRNRGLFRAGAGSSRSLRFGDNFAAYADGNLPLTDLWGSAVFHSTPQISGGTFGGPTSGTFYGARWTGPQPAADQWAEVDVNLPDHDDNTNVFLNLRWNNANANCYQFQWSATAGGILKINVIGVGAPVNVAGQGWSGTLRGEAQGNDLRLYLNGVLKLTYTDPSALYPTGQLALATQWDDTSASPQISSFRGGSL